MNILFITLGVYSRVGGIERFNQRVVRCLAEMSCTDGYQSKLISLWDTPANADRVPSPVGFGAASGSKPRAAAAFLGSVVTMHPDVILYGHILLTPLAIVARLISRRTRQLLFVHGVDAWGPPHRPIPPGEAWITRRLIDRIVAVSTFTAERMRLAYGIPADCFTILPNAADVDAPLYQSAMSFATSDGGARLLTVARLADRYKGCDQVIRALPDVLARFPNAVYEIVGDGPLKPRLQALAEQVGVSERVRFLGAVSDRELEDAYRRANIFVMPSSGEGFGIVYLEAWKHKLPVIAGNRDAGSEVVTHGVNGLTVDPSSPAEVARAITMLLADRDLSASLGQQGYQTLLARYTHQHFLGGLRRILEEESKACAASRA